MPAGLRAHASRARPYDRHSSTASPTPSQCHPRLSPHSLPPASPIEDTESPPDHPGLPTYAEYKRIEAGYLHSLSPRKRDKALITQAMFDKIWDVLHQPEASTIETPQFRFWVRKMFTLSRPGGDGEGELGRWGASPRPRRVDEGAGDNDNDDDDDSDAADLELARALGIQRTTTTDSDLLTSAVVLHEHRPVAIMEQLYELFCYCHVRAGHGGRDKTCAVIRQHYSWVPKELTAQFVKACPTCALKRSGGGELVHHRRAGKERRGRKDNLKGRGEAREVKGEEALAVGWPTTGGPLDPANAPPCGVRAREDAETITGSPPILDSPARAAEVPLSGWNSMTAPPSPLHACGAAPAYTFGGAGLSPHTFSFGAPLNVSPDGHDAHRAYPPPMLRPFRLSGPGMAPPNTASEVEDADMFQIDPVLLSFSHPGLPIATSGTNSGPGVETGMSIGLGLVPGAQEHPLNQHTDHDWHGQDQEREQEQHMTHVNPSNLGLYAHRLRPRPRPRVCHAQVDTASPSDGTTLGSASPSASTAYSPSASPDSSFSEHPPGFYRPGMASDGAHAVSAVFLPLTELPSPGRCYGHDLDYGHSLDYSYEYPSPDPIQTKDDGLGMLLHLPCVDISEVGRGLDGTLSRFSIQTDA